MVETAEAGRVNGQMSLAEWAMLALLGAIWGGSFFFARIAVAEMAPLTLVMFRVLIAAAALQIWLAASGSSLRLALPRWADFFCLAILNNVIPFSLIFLGQTVLGAGIASVLNATTPFWTAIIAGLLMDDEKLTWPKIVGILFGIAGTAVMIGPGLLAGMGGPVWPKLALIGAALSYGLAFIYARRLRDIPPPVLATGQLTVSSVIMIPLVLIVDGPTGLFSASGTVWASVFALALLSTAFAYILFFRLVATAGSTNTSLVTLIVPVSAILLGATFLGERLGAFEMAGIVLIGCGLVTIDGRLVRRMANGL